MVQERQARGRGVGLVLVGMVLVAALGGSWLAKRGDAEGQTLGLPPGTRVGYHHATGLVRFLGAAAGEALAEYPSLSSAEGPEGIAEAFLSVYGGLFGVADTQRDLAIQSTTTAPSGRTAVRYQQHYDGVPIVAGELLVQVDASQRVLAATGETARDLTLDVTPRLASDEACRRALEDVAQERGADPQALTCSEPELWIYDPALLDAPGPRRARLVWRMEIRHADDLSVRELALVDAHMGVMALRFSMVDEAKLRRVHDNANDASRGLPGTLVRIEGGPPVGVTDADAAYAFLGDTYDLYHRLHGRDSWDGAGAPIVVTTRYCPPGQECPYRNAFWNGTQLVFGEGYARADDVVAHEYTHAVTEHTSRLFYYMQSGAINEAFSDIWGEFVDLSNDGDAGNDAERWLVGEDLTNGPARSLSDPPSFAYLFPDTGLQPYPDHMEHPGYYCGHLDNGGVHLNSGIAAKVAYLLTDGGSFGGYDIGPLGLAKTAAVFYEVQTQLLTSGAGYADLHDALIQAAYNLVVDGVLTPPDVTHVERAVAAVGMDRHPPACAVAVAPLCTEGSPQDVFYDDLERPEDGIWTAVTLEGVYNSFYYPQNPNDLGLDATYARSGVTNIWGYDQEYIGDYAMVMMRDVVLPAGAYLRFEHAFAFEEAPKWGQGFGADGGVVEYSIDGGATWQDAGPLFTHNGYTGRLVEGWGNPLVGREAFVSASRGYITSRLDLRSLAGERFRVRFRIGTDDGGNDYGWFIDNIHIYHCLDAPGAATGTPTLVEPTRATPTRATPTGVPHPWWFPVAIKEYAR
ncbi:MAG TPA: M4 family metallopeptidase [Chloroflexi bacterium]|jgi:bacillolysin|nr:M4 family metallopeptidase [Chloroflexota bacterium]